MKIRFSGKRIRQVRELNGVNKSKFAKEIGVTKGDIVDFERGCVLPGVDVLVRICNKYSVEIEYFFV